MIPALCDLTATGLQFVGLLNVPGSVYQVKNNSIKNKKNFKNKILKIHKKQLNPIKPFLFPNLFPSDAERRRDRAGCFLLRVNPKAETLLAPLPGDVTRDNRGDYGRSVCDSGHQVRRQQRQSGTWRYSHCQQFNPSGGAVCQ